MASSPGEKPFPNEAIDACSSVTNPDRCELAVQFAECVMKAASAGGPK